MGSRSGVRASSTAKSIGVLRVRRQKAISSARILEILERQNFHCAISGRLLTPETASLDHVVPVASGGEHIFENIHIVDREVNRAKGMMSLDEFVAMCREVVECQERLRSGSAEAHSGPEVPRSPIQGELF